MFLCCRYDHPKTIDFLREIGVNILKPNKEGVSPLVYCIMRGSFECFKYLIDFRMQKLGDVPDESDLQVIDFFKSIGNNS